ncbi:MAG: HEPN domain-containing protein [Sphaerobacteraceae bacterium]|nr:MAG: HEPN domain-containing protein [Sphaerobacteraceae bacterium]
MPRDRFSADDPREWLQRARSNLAQARNEHPDIYLEDLCFQAQQAAEKALKGVILGYGLEFPYTHDVAYLISVLERHFGPVPADLEDAAVLTRYAVATRYPGVIEPVTRAEYLEVLELAQRVVVWAEQAVNEHS